MSENFTFAKISKNNTYNISCMLVLHMVLNQIIFNYFQQKPLPGDIRAEKTKKKLEIISDTLWILAQKY